MISVEDDIYDNHWMMYGNLTHPASGARAMAYGDYVLIASAYSSDTADPKELQGINVNTGNIFVLNAGGVSLGVEDAATILVNDTIYVFGGKYDSGNCEFHAMTTLRDTSKYLQLSLEDMYPYSMNF